MEYRNSCKSANGDGSKWQESAKKIRPQWQVVEFCRKVFREILKKVLQFVKNSVKL